MFEQVVGAVDDESRANHVLGVGEVLSGRTSASWRRTSRDFRELFVELARVELCRQVVEEIEQDAVVNLQRLVIAASRGGSDASRASGGPR